MREKIAEGYTIARYPGCALNPPWHDLTLPVGPDL